MRYKIKAGSGGMRFVGADPAGTGKVIAVLLAELAQDQLEGWMRSDPTVAMRYVLGPPPPPAPPPIQDNAPGEPLPQAPKASKRGSKKRTDQQ